MTGLGLTTGTAVLAECCVPSYLGLKLYRRAGACQRIRDSKKPMKRDLGSKLL
jgi:hypothetical protein